MGRDRLAFAGGGAGLSVGAVPVGSWFYTSSPHNNTTSNTLGNNSLRLLPVLIPNEIVLSGLAADVATAGQAGAKFRLGVYRDNGHMYPGDLVVDAGQIAGDSATVQSITGLSARLTPGLYWFGGAVQLAATTQPTMRVVGTNSDWQPPMFFGVGASLPSAGGTICGYTQTSVSAGLPATFTASGSIAATVARLLAIV